MKTTEDAERLFQVSDVVVQDWWNGPGLYAVREESFEYEDNETLVARHLNVRESTVFVRQEI